MAVIIYLYVVLSNVADCKHAFSYLLFPCISEPARLDWKEVDMTINGISVSWTQESPDLLAGWPNVNTTQTYSLTVSHGSSSQTISLLESSYYFPVPDNSSSCEVYNFSVAATYVGATASCSVPSPVISRMLPPLPDIHQVESSLTYSLTKYGKKGIILSISFKVCKTVITR